MPKETNNRIQQISKFLAVAGLLFFLAAVFYGITGCGREKTQKETDSLQADLPKKIDFNFHIKPISSDRCFTCHGSDANKREADLRLDTEEGTFAALNSLGKRHAITKGNLDESKLFQRLISKDPDLVMPPPNSNLTLSTQDNCIDRRMDQTRSSVEGTLVIYCTCKPEFPVVKQKDWVANPIDLFVLNRLEQKGLQPSSQHPKKPCSAGYHLT